MHLLTMKTKSISLLTCAAGLCALAAGPLLAQAPPREEQRPAQRPENAASQLAAKDEKFVRDAVQGNLREVRMGELARERGGRAEVKEFGRTLAGDHSRSGADLKALAARKNIQVAEQLDPAHSRGLEELGRLSGSDFDKTFLSEAVRDHKKDISEFEDASKTAKDPDVRAFADRTLPTLRTHLERAQALQGQGSAR